MIDSPCITSTGKLQKNITNKQNINILIEINKFVF